MIKDHPKKNETEGPHFLIPNQNELSSILGLQLNAVDYSIFGPSLLNPLTDFLSNQGKRIRTEILEIGFLFAEGKKDPEKERMLYLCSQIIEGLHAGSMIIDDIQDSSEIRRGKSTLHRKYGLAVALNAGTWLYFQAIHQLHKLGLEPTQELYLHRYLNQILLRAHFGQGVDVGTPMSMLPKDQVSTTCLTSMELKTGALMSLGFELGAFIATLNPSSTSLGAQFANEFGVALQMFDDIGNFNSPPPKGREDLKNGRPSFIWAVASELANEVDYSRFIYATHMLPDDSFLNSWAGLFDLSTEAKKRASKYLWMLFEKYSFSPALKDRLESLFIKLERSYG